MMSQQDEQHAAQPSVTQLLLAWRGGDDNALSDLVPQVYDELRRLARSHMRRAKPGHTLSATALVHESFMRLVDADVTWQDRAHFLAVGARVMRRILIDRCRRRARLKRGAGGKHVPLDEVEISLPEEVPTFDLLALDSALADLSEIDPRKAQVVELTFFGGLGYDEVAEALTISRSTVHRDLTMAKAWLYDRLAG